MAETRSSPLGSLSVEQFLSRFWQRRRADARVLDPRGTAELLTPKRAAALVEEWYRAGWLRPGSSP